MMRKRILSAAFILLLLSESITGCSLTGKFGSTEQPVIHAKELSVSKDITIDYSEPSMQPVQQFGYNLLAQNLEEENPILSPVSAYINLCMLGNGAEGKTKEELQNVLDGDMMCIPDDMMNTMVQDKEDIQMSIASSAWMDENFIPDEKWPGIVKSLFDASTYHADLDTDITKDDINHWVSEHTNQMIPSLLEMPLESQTVLALVNALYFHAKWMNPFEPVLTREDEFTVHDGSVQNVQMMHTIGAFDYFKDDASEGVVLPYTGSNFAFVAVKPLEKADIREWYASCTAEKLNDLIESRKETDIEVALPKFTVRCRKELNESLKKMGIARAFDMNQADFTSIGRSKNGTNLYVSFIMQEAVIKVAEEGTEASAATLSAMNDGGAAFAPELITFNRPFLYMIMDMESGAPVFMGILENVP